MKDMNLNDKTFIMITPHGIVANGFDKTEVMSMLMYAFVDLWDEHVFHVDKKEVSMHLLDSMDKFRKTNDEDDDTDILDMLHSILDDDDDEEDDDE